MNTISAHPKRFDRDALLAVIQDAGGRVRGNTIHCPFHQDKRASAGIYQDGLGVWRFKCHSCGFGGDIFDVESEFTGTKVLPETQTKAETKPCFPTLEALRDSLKGGNAIATYPYHNPDTGNADLVVFRFQLRDGSKSYVQGKQSKRGFELGAPAKPWPLYNRGELRNTDRIVVAEGEKCVEALRGLGIVATTSPAGAGKAPYADWSLLAAKDCILWPDNDEPGAKHIAEVARILDTLTPPAKVYRVNVESLNLPAKGDVADMIAACQGDPKEKIVAVLDGAKLSGAAAEVEGLIEATITGRRSAIPFPWTHTSRLTKALLPGTVTLLCGDPGSTKTFALLQCLAYWHEQGIRVACWMLEEGRSHHLHRALAQRVGESRLTDDEWVKVNSVAARMFMHEHTAFLDSFGRCIHDAPTDEPTLTRVAEWIEKRIADGCRVIAVDPITAAVVPDKQWVEDSRFLGRVKRALKDADASLILVTHPKAGRRGVISLEQMAGSQAYARFAQTIVWLEFHPEPIPAKVRSVLGGREEVSVNRTLHLSKTRNGRGGGLRVAFSFSDETLRLEELGVILK